MYEDKNQLSMYYPSTLAEMLRPYDYPFQGDLNSTSERLDDERSHPNDCNHIISADACTYRSCQRNICPLDPQNIIDAMSEQESYVHRSGALCDTLLHRKPKRVRLIVFGGSNTYGTWAGYCCCNSLINDNCPAEMSCENKKFDLEGMAADSHSPYCNWFAYFSRWLKNKFPGLLIEATNLAIGGHNSDMMSQRFANELKHVALTRDDIVILDHSWNDEAGLQNAMGLEELIRVVLHFTEKFTPNVILLYQRTFNLRGEMNPANYYKQLARYYNLPFWNYNDVIGSGYFSKMWEERDLPINEIIQIGEVHPLWITHRFVADVFSACMDRTLDICARSESPFASPSFDMRESLNVSKNSLPAPLYLASHHSKLCDDSQPFLLRAYANSTFHPHNVTEYELYNMSTHGWQQYVDFKAVPGYIFNNNSDKSQKVLSLPFIQETNTSIIPSGYAIKILYIKSYENMGIATVYICGRQVIRKKLDGLRQDFKVNRISTPSMFFAPLDEGGYLDACNRCPEPERRLEIVWQPCQSVDH